MAQTVASENKFNGQAEPQTLRERLLAINGRAGIKATLPVYEYPDFIFSHFHVAM